MSRCDYKIVRKTTTEKGTVITIRLYEGDITTEKEANIDTGKLADVTRYRRTKMIGEKTYIESNNQTAEETRTYLNDKLKVEVPTKTPIDEQDNAKIIPV